MLLTTEDFWCPSCGRLPRETADMYVAPGQIGGWSKLTCQQCGSVDGDLCCRGDTAACRMWNYPAGSFCSFHGNFIGANPHPFGRAVSRSLVERHMKEGTR